MLDFFIVSTKKTPKKGTVEIYPTFLIKKSSDLMIRGGDFYAVWVEERKLWSTDEQDVIHLVDQELDRYADEYKKKHSELEESIYILHMWDANSGIIDRWHKYCQKQMRDNFHMLDEKLIFSNMDVKKTDYASKKLSYPLESGDISAYDELVSVLYSPEERHKIEWAIGSVVSGDSKTIQKFVVLYGAAGTGKSTILNVIQKLFEGYYSVFDAKALGSSSNSFALEAFKANPLVAIQHDGDLSRIEDNTRLNSLVSHESMVVNEKYHATYENSFKCFLFMGTNRPVKITDAKSGLIRRLIDVSPTGNKVSQKDYRRLVKQIDFELGPIAKHCLDVYEDDPNRYDSYVPIIMLGASNDFYNYVIEMYSTFLKNDGTSLKAAWEAYKTYCDDAKVPYPYSYKNFKEELRNYFWEFDDRVTSVNGSRVRNYYSGFRTDKFEQEESNAPEATDNIMNLDLTETDKSIFDSECADCPAQCANDKGTPLQKWSEVETKLSDLDTTKLHYVKVPKNHIVIDFDLKDEAGNKSLERNLEAARKWPQTYSEVSKSGSGLHLHYIYAGDASKLSRIYAEDIEIKVFTGNSSLRRKLSRHNDLPIATLSSGLPLKGEKMVNTNVVQTEKGLRTTIKKCLRKEIHADTRSNIDFIFKILEDAYNSDLVYDVSDMENAVIAFAAQSTHQADYCVTLTGKMKFKSKEPPESKEDKDALLAFFDVEVFPNLFLVNWKIPGEGHSVIRMINPKPWEIEELLRYNLIGFNCRRYDNHMLYACMIGYNNQQLYELSQKIISGNGGFFGEAYNLSYTDVYDFSSKKQSLKKFEIELGIHHQELGLPWDQPVPEEMWMKVAEYCDNDVIATEAVFNARKADFTAREILADVAGMTVNDTTNSLTTRIIFGTNKKPQDQFNYRNMAIIEKPQENLVVPSLDCDWDYTVFDGDNRPVFPGYKFEAGKSTYRDEEVGEGGYVYSEPGMYTDIALLDIASMHPSSIVAERLFGSYTDRFNDILNARIAIKHKDFDKAKTMLGGALAKYLDDESMADALAQALKIAINSVYGLTSANFENPFRDIRNKDNIVAKRGALFMINLKHEVQHRGFTVAHIKTDSIKIPNATPDIIQFVVDYGNLYGYNFEHEATYDRMCLVNDAVYIAKYASLEHCVELYGENYVSRSKDMLKDNKKHPGEWTATGTQFQVPYVFKTLFSKEPIEFSDMCETKSVTSALYLDMNEGLPDVSAYEKSLDDYRKDHKKGNLSDKALAELELELGTEIAEGHNYIFIGKVGLFCPIKPGCGGGILVREKDGKYNAATGSKGYRWQEAEVVKTLGKEDCIDRSYYNKLVDAAVSEIGKYGDFEWFVSDDTDAVAPWFAAENSEDCPFDVR